MVKIWYLLIFAYYTRSYLALHGLTLIFCVLTFIVFDELNHWSRPFCVFMSDLRDFLGQDWFQVMPNLLSSEGWGMALARPKASLSHCTCPWGGHLIKFNLRSITIQNAPEKTSNILVRPEVRFAFQNLCPMNGNKISDCDFIAPGEAVLRSATSWRLMRLCTFAQIRGEFGGPGLWNKWSDVYCIWCVSLGWIG